MHSSVGRPAFRSRSQASRGGPRQSSPTLFILSLATKAAGALSVLSIFVAFSKKRMGCVMNNAIRVCLLISVFCIANHAEGGVEGKLPDNVRPLTANEVVNIYSTASFPASHPLFRGGMTRMQGPIRKILEQYDVLFSVGGDLFTLSLPSDIEPMPKDLTLIHLDNDAWELGKNYPPQVAILGDPKATLPDIVKAVRERMSSWPEASRAMRRF
jgi:thiamine pyrophosphate-dependent acetolactate synthase large subunit-like protein